jgi:plastocyanin
MGVIKEKRLFKSLLFGTLVILAAFAVACNSEEATVEAPAADSVQTPKDAAPREITLLVGSGQDTTSVNAFLPTEVTVRVGDTVTWKLGHPDEPHTTTFLSKGARPPVAIPIAGGGPTDFQMPPQVAFPSRAPGAPVEDYTGTAFASSGVMSNVPAGPPGTPPTIPSL